MEIKEILKINIRQTPEGWEVFGKVFTNVDDAYHYARSKSKTAELVIIPRKVKK